MFTDGIFSMNFLGKDSYADYELKIKNRPPMPKAQRRVEYIVIPQRNGRAKIDEGTYDDISFPVNFELINKTDIPQRARDIKSWLDGGEGDLIFSDEQDKKYIAQCVNSFDIEQELINYGKFTAQFNCGPFANSVDDLNETIMGNTVTRAGLSLDPLQWYNFVGGTVYQNNQSVGNSNSISFNCDGTEEANPVITVYGSGTITLTMNGEIVTLNNVSSYITVDSSLQDCYKDGVLQNGNMSGEFPILIPGINTISWAGSVERIEIKCNSAWL